MKGLPEGAALFDDLDGDLPHRYNVLRVTIRTGMAALRADKQAVWEG